MARRDVLDALLERHGRTFASEVGIRLGRGTPAPLFQLLCFALLASARISTGVAVDAARALFDAGWTTVPKLARSSWEERVRALNDAGFGLGRSAAGLARLAGTDDLATVTAALVRAETAGDAELDELRRAAR